MSASGASSPQVVRGRVLRREVSPFAVWARRSKANSHGPRGQFLVAGFAPLLPTRAQRGKGDRFLPNYDGGEAPFQDRVAADLPVVTQTLQDRLAIGLATRSQVITHLILPLMTTRVMKD